jgi:hypothetical protein
MPFSSVVCLEIALAVDEAESDGTPVQLHMRLVRNSAYDSPKAKPTLPRSRLTLVI